MGWRPHQRQRLRASDVTSVAANLGVGSEGARRAREPLGVSQIEKQRVVSLERARGEGSLLEGLARQLLNLGDDVLAVGNLAAHAQQREKQAARRDVKRARRNHTQQPLHPASLVLRPATRFLTFLRLLICFLILAMTMTRSSSLLSSIIFWIT